MNRKSAIVRLPAWIGRFAVTLVVALLSMPEGFAQGVLADPQLPAHSRNALAQAAGNVGVRRCLPALVALSSMGVRGMRNNDVLFDWDRRRPDSAAVFSLLGLESEKGNAVMSVSAVPESDDSCSVEALRIAFDPRRCKLVAQHDLKGYQATPLIPHMMVYTRSDEPGSTVSLVDAAPGCLTIRRYVKFSSVGSVSGTMVEGR